jgi:hypothetical protein
VVNDAAWRANCQAALVSAADVSTAFSLFDKPIPPVRIIRSYPHLAIFPEVRPNAPRVAQELYQFREESLPILMTVAIAEDFPRSPTTMREFQMKGEPL